MRERFAEATLMALKKEEGATNQGMKEASKSWTRQGNGLSPRASGRSPAELTP